MTSTELLTVTDVSAPVFVDASGRRARRLRILGFVVCVVLAVCFGALASGLFGSAVDLSTAMPSVTASATASAAATAR